MAAGLHHQGIDDSVAAESVVVGDLDREETFCSGFHGFGCGGVTTELSDEGLRALSTDGGTAGIT